MIRQLFSKTINDNNMDFTLKYYDNNHWQKHVMLALELTNKKNTYLITNASVEIARMIKYKLNVDIFPIIIRNNKQNYLLMWGKHIYDGIITYVNVPSILDGIFKGKEFKLVNQYIGDDTHSSHQILEFDN